MSVVVGPKINLTDCILNLDARNPVSYRGAGSVWHDLSGNGNHFTLQNTPTWDGSRISFNTTPGSNQYAICTNSTCGDFNSSSFTVELVIDLPTTQGNGVAGSAFMSLIKNRELVSFNGNNNPGFAVGILNQATFQDNDSSFTNNSQHLFNAPSTDYPLANQSSHHAYTIKRGATNPFEVTGSVYRNGVLQRTINYLLEGDGLINGQQAITLMNRQSSFPYATGSLYSVKLYTRALSATEMQNNYQVYRRYYNF